MKRQLILPLAILMFVLCVPDASAQWQFCFGMSPGVSKTFPLHPAEGLKFPPVMSVTLQAGINYSFNRTNSAMLLFSFSQYSPAGEFEIEESHNYPLSKKLRIKSSAGVAVAFLDNVTDALPKHPKDPSPYYISNQDNLFIVLKSGLQWQAPGHRHSVGFGFDYHWGIIKAHQVLIYNNGNSSLASISSSSPSSILKGRGSYLALNMIIFIGKEKYSWKKVSNNMNTRQRNFVM